MGEESVGVERVGVDDSLSASFFFEVSTQTMWGSSGTAGTDGMDGLDGKQQAVLDDVVFWIKVGLGGVVAMGVWWLWVVVAAFAVSPMWGFTLVFPLTAPIALIAFVWLFGLWRKGYRCCPSRTLAGLGVD